MRVTQLRNSQGIITMLIRQLILTLLLLMTTLLGMADDDSDLGQVGPTITCPPLNAIFQNSQRYWGTADSHFRNFDISVSNKLDAFLGAQWQGTNIGRITCVYKPHPPEVFLITLLYNDLAYLPTGKNWKLVQKRGVYNCTSRNVTDCPFAIRAKTPKSNIYKDALELRQEANPYDTPGF